jgi:hypothetical protein
MSRRLVSPFEAKIAFDFGRHYWWIYTSCKLASVYSVAWFGVRDALWAGT